MRLLPALGCCRSALEWVVPGCYPAGSSRFLHFHLPLFAPPNRTAHALAPGAGVQSFSVGMGCAGLLPCGQHPIFTFPPPTVCPSPSHCPCACSRCWGAVGQRWNGLCRAVTLRAASDFYISTSHCLPLPIALPMRLLPVLGGSRSALEWVVPGCCPAGSIRFLHFHLPQFSPPNRTAHALAPGAGVQSVSVGMSCAGLLPCGQHPIFTFPPPTVFPSQSHCPCACSRCWGAVVQRWNGVCRSVALRAVVCCTPIIACQQLGGNLSPYTYVQLRTSPYRRHQLYSPRMRIKI